MWSIITDYGHLLLKAMGKTLLLALCGLFFACILGLFFGILSVLKSKVSRAIATVFVDIIRGVPMIVLAFFIYFGIPYFFKNYLNSPITFTGLQAGTIALALNCGAYMAEIIRAGIQSVDKGQMEAARSAGYQNHDSEHNKSVYHNFKGYLNSFRYRIPRACKQRKEYNFGNLQVLPDLAYSRNYVFHNH